LTSSNDNQVDNLPEWQKALQEVRRLLQQKERQRELEARKTPYHERQEKVVNSTIKWEPIDKTTALVVSPAHWPFTPPDPEKSHSNHSVKPAPDSTDNTSSTKTKPVKPAKLTDSSSGVKGFDSTSHKTSKRKRKGFNMAGESQPKTDVSRKVVIDGNEYFHIDDIATKVIAEIEKKVPRGLSNLATAAEDSRRVIDESMRGIGGIQQEFDAKLKLFLEDLRQTRFAVVAEVSQLSQPLKDIRQFFLGKDYEMEMARLRQFVELCERLVALKRDGTLDAVSDTIIKLAL
jgi:hypothetical protein